MQRTEEALAKMKMRVKELEEKGSLCFEANVKLESQNAELREALKNFVELIDNCIKGKEASKLIPRHYAYQNATQALAKTEGK